MILTLPIATRERLMLRLHEAEATKGKMPTRIVLGPGDYAKLLLDLRRYGFFPSKYLPKKPNVLQVPIECDDVEETAPEHHTVRFEWSE